MRPPVGSTSSRAVATDLPPACVASMIRAAPPPSGTRCAVTSSTAPGAVNERTLTCVIRTGTGRVPAGRSGACPASSSAMPISASSSSVAGNTGRRGKWSAKNGALAGTCSVAARLSPGTPSPRTTSSCGTPRKRPGAAPAPRSSAKALGHRLGRVELRDRQHRAEAVDELDDERAAAGRAARVGDRVVVAGVDVDRELQQRARRHVAMEARLGRRAPRPAGRGTRCAPSTPTPRAARPPRRRGRRGTPRAPPAPRTGRARGPPGRTR